MDKYNKLINNSFVFAIGSFGSKIIVLLLVPLYTHYLTSEDYGVVDLLTSTQALVLPFITLTLEQAILRFVVNEQDKEKIRSYFSSSVFIIFVSFIIFTVLILTFYYIEYWDRKLLLYFYLLICASSCQVILSTHLRALGKSKLYALNGIVQVLVLLCCNFSFLVYLKMGTDGYLISLILSYLVSCIYCLVVMDGFYFSTSLINKLTMKRVLLFSIPLIPNYSMWWLVNNSTRYVVLGFLGLQANGLFAVASKIPMCVNMFVTVFQQAWQLSAFEEFNSLDRSKYYSSVFRYYYQFLFLVASFLLVINKFIFAYAISDGFYDAWKMVPFLVLSVLYQTFSAFLGTIYTANFSTRSVFLTSAVGAAIAIVSNFFFIPFLGADFVGVGACLGFFIMWAMRLHDTRKIVYIVIRKHEFFALNLLFVIQVLLALTFPDVSLFHYTALQLFLFVIVLFITKEFITSLLVMLKKRILTS